LFTGRTDATRVADGLTAAANKSFNSVESLGESLKYAAPVAADANMSLEETLAILGSLGNMGIQGSDAGTSLRRLLTLTAAQAEKFKQEFGVATTDAAGNVRPLVDVMGEVATATNKLPTGARAAKFNEVFGMLGITSASAIGKSVADTRTLYDELMNAGGAAADTAKQMDAGIGGAFRILKSAAEGVAIAFGEAIDGPLQKLTKAISGMLSAIIGWIEANRKTVRTVALVVAGILAAGAALVALGTMFVVAGSVISGVLTTVGLVTASFAAAGAVLSALLSPIGLVSVAVVGLGAYLIHASGAGSAALAWLGERFTALKSTAVTALGAIGQALAAGDMVTAGKILWLTLKLEWQRGIQFLQGYWLAFKEAFLKTTDAIIYGAAGILSDGWAAVETAWLESIGFLADSWSLFTSTLQKTWNSTIGFIRKAWVRLKGLFDNDLNVQSELSSIDSDTNSRNAAVSDSMLGEIGDRDAARRSRQSEIERERQDRSAVLASMRAAEQDARDRASQAAISGTAAELEQAKKEWKDAIAALRETDSPADSPATPGSLKQLRDSLAQAGMATAAAQSDVETKSTFNAFAIRGLGADSLSDRALKAAEATAANTKKLIQTIENNGLAYS
jgi:hypothetical protein